MFAAPPVANLLVIRSPNIDRAADFYRAMGMLIRKHAHGSGPEHYTSKICGFVFEIYPLKNPTATTTHVRLGFNVDDVDSVVEMLLKAGAALLTAPVDTEWGRRAVVRDFDGHTVELLTPVNREANIDRHFRVFAFGDPSKMNSSMPNTAAPIRKASLEDLPAMVELARRSWLSAFAQTAPFELIAWWAKTNRTQQIYDKHWPKMYVLYIDDELAGLVQPQDDEINGLWVHPARQGQGLGTQLLNFGEDLIRQAGHTKAWLTCAAENPRGLAFYHARGYREVSRERVKHASGVEIEDVRLERELGEATEVTINATK